MKAKFFLVAAILFGMGISSANAQPKHRSLTQKQRIKQGVRSGELTRAETKNLIEDRKQIHQDVKLAKSDGKIARRERKIIEKEQRRESREIYRKKHNNRERH